MAKWQVELIESEAGWGSRVDEVKYWPESEKDKALEFVKEFNSYNNEPTTPSWYMYATKPVLVEG